MAHRIWRYNSLCAVGRCGVAGNRLLEGHPPPVLHAEDAHAPLLAVLHLHDHTMPAVICLCMPEDERR
jgi:hypothetical protein